MGLFVGDGDGLANMLLNQQASCTKCGAAIKFESGANLAKEYGINDNVVMCSKCKSVFTVQLVPGRMTLTQNVSDRYASLIKSTKASSGSKTDDGAKPSGGFFKKLFEKH